MKDNESSCKDWYGGSYGCEGFKAQRLYTNEELCWFIANLKVYLEYINLYP